jgi:hypothetical protein
MEYKLFLGIILIIAIIYQLFLTIKEGACNYNDGGNISGTGKGMPVSGRNKDSCQESGIITNKVSLDEVSEKLNELKKIASNTENGIYSNSNQIKKNRYSFKRLKAAGDGDDGGSNDDPECDKYPSACKDQAPYKTLSKSEFKKKMRR